MAQLQREDYTLPYWKRIIPVKIEMPVLPIKQASLLVLPRTAVVRNMFLGAVEGITQEAVNFIKL